MKKFNYKNWITERKWNSDDHFDPNDPDGQHRSMRRPSVDGPSRMHTPIDDLEDEPIESGCPCPDWMGGGTSEDCCTIDEHSDGTDHNHSSDNGGDKECYDFDNPETPRCWYCKGGGNPCVQVGTGTWPPIFPDNYTADQNGMDLYSTKNACLSAPGNEECTEGNTHTNKKKRCQCCINGQPHSMNAFIPVQADCSQHFGYQCADHSLNGGPSHTQFAETCKDGRGNDNGNADVLRYRCDAGGCLQCPPGSSSTQCPYSSSTCNGACSGGSSSQKRAPYDPDEIITLPDGTQTKPRNEQLRETIQKIKRIIKRSHLNEQEDIDQNVDIAKMPDLQKLASLVDTEPTQDGPEQQMAMPSSMPTPGIHLRLRTCSGGLTMGASYCYNDLGGMAVGDVVKITATSGGNTNMVGRQLFVKEVHGTCGSPHFTIQAIPSGPGVCRNCCFSSWGGAGNSTPSGACTAANNGGFGCCLNGPNDPSCTTTSSTGCNSSQWSNHQNWINTWTNNNAFNSSNPNQPCTHICNRIQTWTNNLSGAGPVQTNVLACKIDSGNNQAQIHNCNC